MVAKLRGLGFTALLGACFALGCGGEQTESAPGEAAAPPGEQAAPAASAGEIWQTTLPADFPTDVPQYPGALVSKARSTPQAGVSASFTSSDEAAKIASYYTDSFAAEGWTTQRIDGPDGIMVFANKDDRSATIGVGPSEGGSKIDLLIVEMR